MAPGNRQKLIGIFALALCLRVICMVVLPPTREWVDASTYETLASQIVDGKGFTSPSGEPTRIRPPGYPLFIAAVYLVAGKHPLAAVFVQAILGSLGALLVFNLASRFADSRVALTASLITASYPALIFYDSRMLREGFTAVLILLGVIAAFRAREQKTTGSYLWLGAAVGAASMTRPETVLLAAPLAWIAIPGIPSFRRSFRPALLIAGTIAIAWTPWTVRNVILFDSISPVHAGLGSTVWFGSRWANNGGDDQRSIDRSQLQAETRAIQSAAGREKADSVFLQKVIGDITSRPTWFLEMVGRKAIIFWKDANGVRKTLPKVHPALPYLANTYYYALLILALIAAVHFGRHTDARRIAITVLVFCATYALLHVRNRYRIPILPMVFILSSIGFWGCLDAFAARSATFASALNRLALGRSAAR